MMLHYLSAAVQNVQVRRGRDYLSRGLLLLSHALLLLPHALLVKLFLFTSTFLLSRSSSFFLARAPSSSRAPPSSSCSPPPLVRTPSSSLRTPPSPLSCALLQIPLQLHLFWGHSQQCADNLLFQNPRMGSVWHGKECQCPVNRDEKSIPCILPVPIVSYDRSKCNAFMIDDFLNREPIRPCTPRMIAKQDHTVVATILCNFFA